MESIPCENQDVCPLRDTQRGCFEDVHHAYWPAKDYKSQLRAEFRALPDNKVRLCRNIHNTEHATQEPPEMPSNDVMREAVRLEQLKRKNGLV